MLHIYFIVEIWSSEADLVGKEFLMFNQFCYSCVRRSKSERKKFSAAVRKLEWPLLDSVVDTSVTSSPGGEKLNYLSKIGNLNRFPRDPYMLSLCSWKQEQVEGVGVVTFIVENIVKKLELDASRILIIKTGLCRTINPGETVVTRLWVDDWNQDYFKIYFDTMGLMSGKPIIHGKVQIKFAKLQ